MAKHRGKLKGARITLARSVQVHDRRASDLIHKDVAPIEVDDPFEEGAKIIAMRSLRDDPLGALHNGGHIDDLEYRAGREWQKAYELAEIGGARAIDYSVTKVDGGQIPQPTVSDKQAKAMSDLAAAAKALGEFGCSVVYDILARGMTAKQCANSRMMTSEAELKFIRRRFRECLGTMTVVFGLATREKI